MRCPLHRLTVATISVVSVVSSAIAAEPPATRPWAKLAPDVVVAQDGTGQFKTIAEALKSLDVANKDRVVVYVKNGLYTDQLAINRPNVTLLGESRDGVRVAFAIPRGSRPGQRPTVGRAVINVNADDVVLQNITFDNTQTSRQHAFTIYGRGTRTATIDCAFLSEGNDTVSLWAEGGGQYYHARCAFRGNIDLLCPRGWCYVRDSTFFAVWNRAILWHDGGRDPRKKLVVVNSSFDGAEEHSLGRYPRDSQFYLLGCRFSAKTTEVRSDDAPDQPGADFRWGRRVYFADCHREGGDAPWHADNLASAAGSPAPADVTAAWTFDGKWDPERADAPRVTDVRVAGAQRVVEVTFSEPVTVRGRPVLVTRRGHLLAWTGAGNGGDTLAFAALDDDDEPAGLGTGPDGGAVFATAAGAWVRPADLRIPTRPSSTQPSTENVAP